MNTCLQVTSLKALQSGNCMSAVYACNSITKYMGFVAGATVHKFSPHLLLEVCISNGVMQDPICAIII